jgi:hypothetical protein
VTLEPPALPDLEERVRWRGAVAVFGPGASTFGNALAEGLGANIVRIELRHAAGWKSIDATVHCHPSALLDLVRSLRGNEALTLGIGSPFALAVQADLSVCILGRAGFRALAPIERRLARSAELVLEEPRLATARALADRLAGSVR